MEIQNNPKGRDNRPGQIRSSSGKPGAESAQANAGFQQIMAAGADSIRESLDNLMLQVDEAAQALLKNPSEAELTRYTQSVREFIRKAQGEAFHVSREFDRHNRLYMIVREVDAQLAELTDKVLYSQGTAIEMASRIQEIRGILMDMYI